jgi:hypothetical protein
LKIGYAPGKVTDKHDWHRYQVMAGFVHTVDHDGQPDTFEFVMGMPMERRRGDKGWEYRFPLDSYCRSVS